MSTPADVEIGLMECVEAESCSFFMCDVLVASERKTESDASLRATADGVSFDVKWTPNDDD